MWVDVDGAAGTALATQHLIDRGHTRIAWIGWRKDSPIGEDRRAGWLVDDARQRPLDHGPGLAGRGRRRTAAPRRPPYCSTSPRPPPSSARPTPSPWACCTPSGSGSSRPARDIAVVGFDDSQVAQVYPVGLTSVRQPLEDVAVEIVRTLRALLSHQPVESRGVLLDADAGDPRVELTRGQPDRPRRRHHRQRTAPNRGDAVARRDDDFVAFVDARSAALLRTARLLTAGDQHAAEDLVQTSLEKAYVAWPRIQRKGAQEAYVRSIMTRAAIDRTRQRSRRGEVVTDDIPDVPVHQVGPEDRDQVFAPARRPARRASARSSCSATTTTSPRRRSPRCSAAAPGRSRHTPPAPSRRCATSPPNSRPTPQECTDDARHPAPRQPHLGRRGHRRPARPGPTRPSPEAAVAVAPGPRPSWPSRPLPSSGEPCSCRTAARPRPRRAGRRRGSETSMVALKWARSLPQGSAPSVPFYGAGGLWSDGASAPVPDSVNLAYPPRTVAGGWLVLVGRDERPVGPGGAGGRRVAARPPCRHVPPRASATRGSRSRPTDAGSPTASGWSTSRP